VNRAIERDLQEALAEADRLDPGWRWDDLEAKRAVISDSENGALRVLEARRLMPDPWPAKLDPPVRKAADAQRLDTEETVWLDELVLDIPPPVLLNERQLRELRAGLHQVAGAVAAARPLTHLSRGRFPYSWPVNILAARPPSQDARLVANMLNLQAVLLAQEEDATGALDFGRAMVNAGRSLGEEPCLVSQLVRVACRTIAINSMERTLARGQASERSLAAAQRLLEEESAEPLLLIGLRGERAGWHRLLDAIEAGQFRYSEMGSRGSELEARFEDLMGKGLMRRSHAPLLHWHTRAVEIAKLPPLQQSRQAREIMAEVASMPKLVKLAAPASDKLAGVLQRIQAQSRCMIATLAAERYRRSKGRWPGSLSDLVSAGLLPKVPTDPYDDAPLRFRATETGLVIYSIGPDEEDNGGKLNRVDAEAKGLDLGFELWNVKQRRQAPKRRSNAPPTP
jgi:hypothetical protein